MKNYELSTLSKNQHKKDLQAKACAPNNKSGNQHNLTL